MKRAAAFFVCCALAGCEPDLSLDDGLLTEPRVLAVRGEPAEAKPGAAVEFTAFIAAPEGAPPSASVVWDFCTAPKPPTENNVVSSECLGASSLVRAGTGSSIMATTPRDGCSLFGPDTPPGGFRPPDPDVTGGYYQPLRADLGAASPVFHLARLLCGLGAAPADIASEFAAEYVPNENPRLLPLAFTLDGSSVSPDAVPLGAHVTLQASWAPTDAETYAYFDRTAEVVTTRREAMSVSWYVTAGTLEAPATGRDDNDSASSTFNAWTAPESAQRTLLWVVLRDSRGGVDFAQYELDVTP
jgi:hypothetical protein